MPKLLFIEALRKIINFVYAPIPAIAYAYAEYHPGSKHNFARTSITLGKKNAQSVEYDKNSVDNRTQFPASSLSKIVFTYLVLQLAKEQKIDLDKPLINLNEPLHPNLILLYEKFKVEGEYPEKALKLTARHILSHTSGLPNLGSNSSLALSFDSKEELGRGYSYSGEAFFFLQKTIEYKMGKDLETLAREHVFSPLNMEHSTFAPQLNSGSNTVAVHTELGKSTSIYVGNPPVHAAGSLLTTAEDFSKFMTAWLERMDDPLFKQAFQSKNPDAFPTCGLGWHLYKNKDELIAYQYGENPNTRSFVAINVNDKKGAAFFTNSENGMSIANQLLCSPNLIPIGDLQHVIRYMHYNQSDEPGWKETIAGKIAEDQGKFGEARSYFEKALALSPEDKSKQLRLEWYNAVHRSTQEKIVTTSLKMFEGIYINSYNDAIKISINLDGSLTYKEFDKEIKLVQISETEFLPEKNQIFKIRFDGNQMTISFVHGGPDKYLSKQHLTTSQEANSYVVIINSLGHQSASTAKTECNALPETLLSKDKPLDIKKPVAFEQEQLDERATEFQERHHQQPKR